MNIKYKSLIIVFIFTMLLPQIIFADTSNLIFEDDFQSGNFDKWQCGHGEISEDGIVRISKATNVSNFSPIIPSLSSADYVFDFKFPVEDSETLESGMKYAGGFLKIVLNNETQPYVLGIWPWQITDSKGAVIGNNRIDGVEMKENNVMYTLKLSINENVIELYRKRANQTDDLYTLITTINDYKGSKTSIDFSGVSTGLIFDNFKIYSKDNVSEITQVDYSSWEKIFNDDFTLNSEPDTQYLMQKWNCSDFSSVTIKDGMVQPKNENGAYISPLSPKVSSLNEFVMTFSMKFKNCPPPKYNEGWFQYVGLNISKTYPITSNIKGVSYANGTEMFDVKVEKSIDGIKFYIKDNGKYKIFYMDEFLKGEVSKISFDLLETGFAMDNVEIYKKPILTVKPLVGNNGFINAKDNFIDLLFSDAIDKESISSDNVIVMSDKQVDCTYEFPKENICRIVLNEKMKQQSTYKIFVNAGITSKDITFEENKKFTIFTKPFENFKVDFTEQSLNPVEFQWATIENDCLTTEPWGYVKTKDTMDEFIAEFDFMADATVEETKRLNITPKFSVDDAISVYIIFDSANGVHLVTPNGGDSVIPGDFTFISSMNYNLRAKVTKEVFELYAKNCEENEYTLLLTTTEVPKNKGAFHISSGSKAYIDNLSVSKFNIVANVGETPILARPTSFIDLKFSSDMKDETINNSNIRISDDLKIYNTDIIKISDNNYKIVLEEWLEYGKIYNLIINNKVRGIFDNSNDSEQIIQFTTVMTPPKITVENVSYENSKIVADVVYNFKEGSGTGVFACVVYDEDENSSCFVTSNWVGVQANAQQSQHVESQLIIPNDIKNPKIKIFIWDDIIKMNMIATPIVLPNK